MLPIKADQLLGFGTVFLAPLKAIPFLIERPRLWRWVLIPLCINMLLLTILGWLSFTVVRGKARGAVASEESGWLQQLLGEFAGAGAGLAAFSVSILVVYVVAVIISSPFSDLMAEDIERELLRRHPECLAPPQEWWRGPLHSLWETLRRVAVVIPLLMMTLVIGLVPFIGPPIAAALDLIIVGTFLAVDAFGFPLDRRQWKLQAKMDYLKANRHMTVPLALGLMILVPIPCCSALLLPPLAAIAATRVYCMQRIIESQPAPELPPPVKGPPTP